MWIWKNVFPSKYVLKKKGLFCVSLDFPIKTTIKTALIKTWRRCSKFFLYLFSRKKILTVLLFKKVFKRLKAIFNRGNVEQFLHVLSDLAWIFLNVKSYNCLLRISHFRKLSHLFQNHYLKINKTNLIAIQILCTNPRC